MDTILIILGLSLLAFSFCLTLLNRRRIPKQTTWVYCPGCKQELVGSKYRIVTDTDRVRYYCIKCYVVSEWNFDMPVPSLITSYYLDPNDWLNKR